MNKLLLFLSCLAIPVLSAAPLDSSLQLGTSVSHSYDARSVFTNPAALGFQTELNGAELLTAFDYGANHGWPEGTNGEWDLGVSLGYFGFGAESLTLPTGHYKRYNFGFGFPVTPWAYLGTRYSLTRNLPGIGNFDSLDLGLQIRASQKLSFGFLASHLNQPFLPTGTQPIQLIAGFTFRPISMWELSVDADTPTNDFVKTVGYQATTSFEFWPGMKVRVGYHSIYKYMVGLQWNFEGASAYGTAQPGSDARSIVAGAQWAPLPQRHSMHPTSAMKIVVPSSMNEVGQSPGLFREAVPSFQNLLALLERIEKDPRAVPLIVLKVNHFPLGLAAAEEFRQAILRVEEKGVLVEIFLEDAGLKEYYIASACQKIHLVPSGEIRILNPRSEKYFLKGTLDKIGAEGQFLAKGKYKSAPEMFTRKESSPTSNAVTKEELGLIETEIRTQISQTRKAVSDQWGKIIEHALFSEDDALAFKLIDDVQDYSSYMERLEKSILIAENLQYHEDELALSSRIAVVAVEGDIMDRKYQPLSLTGRETANPESFSARMKQAVADPRTKAIVVRIDSPGGEVMASELMSKTLSSAKEKKPVIVSMGDLAASGGYMLAAPGGRIFADSLTLTGSIGVFLGKINLRELYKKIDLHKEITTTSPYPGLMSEDRPWSESETAIMLRRLDQFYSDFVNEVARERKRKPEEIDAVAQGRVWLGSQALEHKLVDEKGGLREAIGYAAKVSHLAGETYEVWMPEEEVPLIPRAGDLLFGESLATKSAKGLLGDEALRDLVRIVEMSHYHFFAVSEIDSIE